LNRPPWQSSTDGVEEVLPLGVGLEQLLHAVQACLQDGHAAPVDAEGRVGVDDGRVGEVVPVDAQQLGNLSLEPML